MPLPTIEVYEGPRQFIDVESGVLVLVSTRAALIAVLGLQVLLVQRLPDEFYDLPIVPGDILLSSQFRLIEEQDPGGA